MTFGVSTGAAKVRHRGRQSPTPGRPTPVNQSLTEILRMPRSGRTQVASRALRRSAAAIRGCPGAKDGDVTLHRPTMARRALRERAREASSAKVASEMW